MFASSSRKMVASDGMNRTMVQALLQVGAGWSCVKDRGREGMEGSENNK